MFTGSTQMTVHNLEGVLALKKLGFKRSVLSRELSLEEIEYICKNSDMEIEVFAHGALCISYSGQCLFSSMIGGRSGNRGKCAQTCRLPFELLEEKACSSLQDYTQKTSLSKIDNGYLLSTRDLCSLEYLPQLINAGVSSLKIEGRMKPPEYVATVTRIYKKYIDLAYKYINKEIDSYTISEKDKLDLLQVFNRGGFNLGHLDKNENRNLVYKKKPNNMGLFLGRVQKYNKNKGIISSKLSTSLQIGDTITFEHENSKYKVSELMQNGKNFPKLEQGSIASFGRMKGNIKLNDIIYKISDNELFSIAKQSFSKEHKKIALNCTIKFSIGHSIEVNVFAPLFNIETNFKYDYIPNRAQNRPITTQNIISQFNKTLDTCFEFAKIDICLNDKLFVPVSVLNDIRRFSIKNMQDKIISSFKRFSNYNFKQSISNYQRQKISIALLLNIIHEDFDYLSLENVDKIYIPLKYFGNKKYDIVLKNICNKFNTYIYLPNIIRKNYSNFAKSIIKTCITHNLIKGIVISNIANLELIKSMNLENIDLVGNYTLNTYNSITSTSLLNLNIKTVTISPELDSTAISNFCQNSSCNKELIVYGNIPVMTMNYCPLGKSNKCYKNCDRKCNIDTKYYLKDRMGLFFRIIPDNTQTISTIYNSKITSIEHTLFNINSARIDVLDENIEEINTIIATVLSGKRLEGNSYTNGNLKRPV